MLRQSRARPVTPSRHSSENNNSPSEGKKLEDRRPSRSSLMRKQSHWSHELKEVTLVAGKDGVFNFRIVGGSDHGDFPIITEVMPPDTRGVEYRGQTELTTQVRVNQLLPEAHLNNRNHRDQLLLNTLYCNRFHFPLFHSDQEY